jgi:hypothetical protein
MRCPSTIVDETGRLLALAEYGLDEEKALPDLEPVVHIAARMLDMPVDAVNMIGSDHPFFAASEGFASATCVGMYLSVPTPLRKTMSWSFWTPRWTRAATTILW